MSKASNRRYLEKRGFLKPKDHSSFSRSEEGKRYQYDNRIAKLFDNWSRTQRNIGKIPLFADFYSELQPTDREQITITEIFKNNETSKTNCR